MTPDPAAGGRPRPPRLRHLDGLRGAAALFVVAHHAFLAAGDDRPRWMHLTDPLHYGHYAVTAFVVLSGYCLMLPVARAGGSGPAGGTLGFLRARAARILPPFYAACAFSAVMVAALALWRGAPAEIPERLTPRVLVAHLLLVHNLVPDTIGALNGAFWSIATEAQLYLLFAFAFLPARRRLGLVPLLLVAHALGFGLHWATAGRFAAACPWYTGMFASGMAAAAVAHDGGLARCRAAPWGAAAFAAWAVVAWVSRDRFWATGQFPALDVLVGLGTAALLVAWSPAGNAAGAGSRGPLRRLIECEPLVRVGGFSYSLYLTHGWFTAVIGNGLSSLPWSPSARFACTLAASLPAAVGFAYVFHLVAERPVGRWRSARAGDPPAARPGELMIVAGPAGPGCG